MFPSASEILFVVGPTASGKSDIALHLARKLGATILAMDSMQVYRGADIGTSKPSSAEQQEIAHGGIDLVEVGEKFDTGAYLKHAAEFLNSSAQTNKPVVIVGGTGLYYRALTQGFCEAPTAPKELRDQLAALPLETLQQRLRAADPGIIPHIDFKNARRIARALEVAETTGKSLREWQKSNQPPLVTRFRSFIIERPREELHARIAERLDRMLEGGWIDEVRQLVARHGTETLARFPAIGYPEITDWLQSGGDFAPVREALALGTRQYAKRQLTWFRRESNLIPVKMALNDLSSAIAERLL
jgi:tRNA dimethylallyltransferase